MRWAATMGCFRSSAKCLLLERRTLLFMLQPKTKKLGKQ
jgi:hypothetical protein